MPVNHVEYLKQLKKQGDFSWQQLADGTNIPVSTIRKMLSGEIDKPNFESLSKLIVFMGGDISALVSDTKPTSGSNNTMEMLNAITAAYENRIVDIKEGYNRHIESLSRDKKLLFTVLGVLIALIVFILVWDITHPTMGYIQY